MIEDIKYEHTIRENDMVEVKRIQRILDDDGKELCKLYHRHVVNPTSDSDFSEENNRTQRLVAMLRNPNDLDELVNIQETIADAEVVSEGETAQGEAEKKATWVQKLKDFFTGKGGGGS